MSEWILCVIQVSIIASSTWLVGRCLLNRRPEVSAMAGVLGMVAAAAMVIATATSIPRPWSIALVTPLSQSAMEVSQRDSTDAQSDPQNILNESHRQPGFSDSPLAARWQIDTIATQLRYWTLIKLPEQARPLHGVVYVAGGVFVLLMIRIVMGSVAIVRLACISTSVNDTRCDPICRDLARRMGIVEPIDIRQHRHIHSPCVSWLVPWTIHLPVGFESWTDDELWAGLAHELAHLKRRDARARLLAELCWSLLCWNPLVFFVRRQITLAQELAADQMAARAIDRQRLYISGLSRLALRFDANQTRAIFASCISVSSSCLIRRIEMLKGFQTSARPTSSALQNMLLGLMIAGCGWLGCWTVQAAPTQAAIQKQTESPASEPLRIAWKEPAAARTASYFVRPNSQPWDLLGNTNGYLSVRIAELLQHPMLKYQVPIVESLAERLLLPAEDGTAQRLADFGMSLDAVRQVDIGTSMLLSISPPNDEQRARGLHRGGISIGGATSRFRIDATRIIDWPSLARAVNFSTWYDSETCTAIAKSIELGIENGRIATTPELTMVSELEPASTPLNACQKQLWQDVHGGVVTWFTRFTAEANLQKLAESALDDPTSSVTERTWWKTAQSISSIAIGLDFTEGSEQEWLRISLEPVDGKSADTIAGELNTFRATFITETNLSQIGLSDSKRDDLIRQLRGLEISAVGSGETARVQIQGPISIATLLQINE